MDAAKARAHSAETVEYEYSTRDVIVYALGIGCKTATDLRYLYEGAEGFMPLPTYIVAQGDIAPSLMNWPGVQFELSRILHGEQYIEMHAPLPREGHLRSENRIVDIVDKGSGALILIEVTTYDVNSGKKLALQQIVIFQVGSGNFGGSRTSEFERKGSTIPTRPADVVVSEQTSVDQAALYRMGSGDMNPLHVDPEFASMAGFKQPILHGLCSLGFASRHVIKAFADNDASLFKVMKCRFATPVIPGQTLETHMWDEGNRVVFEVKVKETGKIVVSNGYMELRGKSGKGKATL